MCFDVVYGIISINGKFKHDKILNEGQGQQTYKQQDKDQASRYYTS